MIRRTDENDPRQEEISFEERISRQPEQRRGFFAGNSDGMDFSAPESRLRSESSDRGGAGSRVLLTEPTFISENERQIDSVDEVKQQLSLFNERSLPINATDSEEGFFDPLVRSMVDNTYKVDVTNLKQGIINPLTNTLGEWHRETMELTRRQHKMNILYLAQIRDSSREGGSGASSGVENAIREGYFSFTRSAFSMISSIFTPIFSGVSTLLFGFKKKEKTTVQAIEDQTQFLRSGKIVDNSSFLQRTLRRGLVGSVIAGGAEMAGMGRSAAQTGEDKVAAGEDLSRREEITRSMMKRFGLFKDIDRKDLTGKGRVQEEQQGVMVAVRDTLKRFFESYKERASQSLRVLKDIKQQQTTHFTDLVSEVRDLVSSIRSQNKSMFTTVENPGVVTTKYGKENNNLLQLIAAHTIMLAGSTSEQLEHLMYGLKNIEHQPTHVSEPQPAFEAAMTHQSSGQSNIVRIDESSNVFNKLPSEIAEEISTSIENESEKRLEVMYTLSRRETRESSQNAFKTHVILNNVKEELARSNRPILSAYEHRMVDLNKRQHDELVRQRELEEQRRFEEEKTQKDSGGGLMGALVLAMRPIGRLAKRFIYLPILTAFKSVGGWIAKSAMKFIVTPLIGAVKVGGAWIARNGFQMLLRAPFAKIFAGGLVAKLFYDYLLRPMVGWFDNTFGTEIGGILDKFTGFFADKFTGMVDWIKNKLAAVPVLGRLFKGDDSQDHEERVANTDITDINEVIKLRKDGVDVHINDMIQRKDQEGENTGVSGMINNIGNSYWGAAKDIYSGIGKASMWAGEKTWDHSMRGASMVANLATGSDEKEEPETHPMQRTRSTGEVIGEATKNTFGSTKRVAGDTAETGKNLISRTAGAWGDIITSDDMKKAAAGVVDAQRSFWGGVIKSITSKDLEEKIIPDEEVKEKQTSMFKSLVRSTADIYSSFWGGFADGVMKKSDPPRPPSSIEDVRRQDNDQSNRNEDTLNRVSKEIRENSDRASKTSQELMEAQLEQMNQVIELLGSVSNNTASGVRAQMEAVSVQMREARKQRDLNTADGDL